MEDFAGEIQKAMEPIVDLLMEENKAAPPPGLLIPEKVWRQNIRQELSDACSGKEIRERLSNAQSVLLEDLERHLSPADFKNFQTEWAKGVEKIEALDPSILPEEGTLPPTLGSVMGISEETMSHLYEVGVRCFKSKEYKKAADVFFFITLIDYLRPNVWTSLALSESQNDHWDVALAAFIMASFLQPENPSNYLECGRCCLELQIPKEAKAYLEFANEWIQKAPEKTRQPYLDALRHLQQQCK